MVSDDFEEACDEPNFNNHNTSPDPPSPYAELEKKYRKKKFTRKKSYYPELFGTTGIDSDARPKVSGNKAQKKKSSVKQRKKHPGKNNRSFNGRTNGNGRGA